MDIRQIRYALTVARERSFTRAALRLNISQSSVSEQVKGLEGAIGFDLFRRTGRGVETTERGRTFLNEAERVAADLLSLSDVARRLKGLGQDNLRMGIGSGLAPMFLPRLFAQGVLPQDLLVEVRTAPTRVVFAELQSAQLDLGLLLEVPPDRVPSGLTVTRLLPVEMVAIAAPGRKVPLAGSRLDMARLGPGDGFIMSEMTVGYGELVSDLFSALGVRPVFRAAVDNVETIKTIVRATDCLAIVPDSAVAQDRQTGTLDVHPLLPACHVQSACYTPRQGTSRRRQALVARVLTAFGERPGTSA
jgi:DNA-binding transcriptional LysR family regulator